MTPDFYSIDRLVEFGMSVGIATQLTRSMNETLQNVHVPGSHNSLQRGAVLHQPYYYCVLDGKSVGPLAASELSRLVGDKRITPDTYVWTPGMPDWAYVRDVPEVLQLVALTPPPLPSEA